MAGVVDSAERRAENIFRLLGLDRIAAPARAVRAVEFGIVGTTGAVVNAVVFVLAPVAYFLAGALAFGAGTAWTFVLNWVVTYDRPGHDLHRAAARYASVYGLGFVVYSVALAVGVEVLHLAAFTANVGAIAVAGTVNFAGSELFALGE